MNLNNLPDVQFADKDINQILNEMVAQYEQIYFEQTGQRKKLYPGDPLRIFLYAQALRELQLRYLIDNSAKLNLLKYSREDFLENLAAFHDVERLPATKAKVKVRFTLSAPQATVQTIPAGTRVSPGGDIYFAVLEDTEVPPGMTEIDVMTECLQEGEIGNGFTPGQINILVDPIPWVESVENIEESQGGANVESDESLRERIRLAPESFSVAGPEGAYEFFAKQYSVLVEDVAVLSPAPGEVNVRVLLQKGQIPEPSFLEGLRDYLSASHRRPLTDYVTVDAPDSVPYNIDLTYYIRTADGAQASDIQAQVEQAVQEFIVWQKSKIGRDINPSELVARIIQAGAKRVEINEPIYTQLSSTEVATAIDVNVTYGGLEDE